MVDGKKPVIVNRVTAVQKIILVARSTRCYVSEEPFIFVPRVIPVNLSETNLLFLCCPLSYPAASPRMTFERTVR